MQRPLREVETRACPCACPRSSCHSGGTPAASGSAARGRRPDAPRLTRPGDPAAARLPAAGGRAEPLGRRTAGVARFHLAVLRHVRRSRPGAPPGAPAGLLAAPRRGTARSDAGPRSPLRLPRPRLGQPLEVVGALRARRPPGVRARSRAGQPAACLRPPRLLGLAAARRGLAPSPAVLERRPRPAQRRRPDPRSTRQGRSRTSGLEPSRCEPGSRPSTGRFSRPATTRTATTRTAPSCGPTPASHTTGRPFGS